MLEILLFYIISKMRLICLFVFVTALISNVTAQSCDPVRDCTPPPIGIGSSGSKVPDPNNCEKYFICAFNGSSLIPSATSYSCPESQYLEVGPPVRCENKINLQFCNDNFCGKMLLSTENLCQTVCPANLPAFIANPSNCSSYNICLPGGTIQPSDCPKETPYFNGVSCVSEKSQCCSTIDAPICTSAYQQLPDPKDCTAYYICGINIDLPEIPSESYKHYCPNGQYYNASRFSCVSGTCSTTTTTTLATTTTTRATTTTTTPSPSGCTSLSNFRCPSDGYYAQCNHCAPGYFHCVGGQATQGSCTGTTVFNPVSSYPACIQPGSCPYYP